MSSRSDSPTTLNELFLELDSGPADAGRVLLDIAECEVDLGNDQGAYVALRRMAATDRSYRSWSRGAKILRNLRRRGGRAENLRQARVSVLGTSTLDQLGPLVELAGLVADLDLEVQVADYGQYESEALSPNSGTYAFSPDAVVLAPDAAALDFPTATADPQGAVSQSLGRWLLAWEGLRRHTTAHVLQLNFAPPYARPLGSLEAVCPGARRNLVLELNRRLAEAAEGANVSIVDVEAVAGSYGLGRWRDDRYWFHARQAVSLGALPWLATEIGSVLRARLGRSRKVLVTDLDNTLWGGVVGDDGVANLKLSGCSVGEAHLALQAHLLDLKSRGVLLAVCSKNEETIARAPFVERDDMLLKLEDFVGFSASWAPKTERLQALAAELNLGLEAFAFLDDNPAERAIIRQMLPMVDVIELPDDVSGFHRAVADYRGFESIAVTGEDASRTQQYRARAAAHELREEATSLEEYLKGLEMVGEVQPFDELTLPRVAQLVGKTNQWNLTTRRHSPEALRRFASDPDTLAFSLRLEDRFASHGIVAVCIAQMVGDELEIDTLLMSCRVIGRTVERTLLDVILTSAIERQVSGVRGIYRPTERNGLVAALYRDLGFSLHDPTDGRHEVWHLSRSEMTRDPNPFIALERRTCH